MKTFPAWSFSVEECLKEYNVKLEKGISMHEVEARRAQYGWNELTKEKRKPLWCLVLEQFDDVLVKILVIAAIISGVIAFLQEQESSEIMGLEVYVEPLVIIAFLFLNAIVGVWQENNAMKALEALKEMQGEHAKVLRDGCYLLQLPARELVPGDIVELRTGNKVPADVRLAVAKSSILRVEQSSLTGESMPVLKTTTPVFTEDCELQLKECMVFAGTTISKGICLGIVTSIGMDTEIGRIHKQIYEASLQDQTSPLKKKLDEFGGRLSTVIGFICLIVWAINYRNFLTWDFTSSSMSDFQFSFEKCTYYLQIAVALAVAAIPEGLPTVITICLSLGTRRMAHRNAIIRKLPSVETLGCTTVICSDKTGTLTTNQMAASEFFTFGGTKETSRLFNVKGTTYNPKDGGITDWSHYNLDASNLALAEICAVCNDAGIFCDGSLVKAMGLPTEAALKVLVEKMGVPDINTRNKIRNMGLSSYYFLDQNTFKLGCCDWWLKRSRRIATLEFDRIRKSMGVIVRKKDGNNRLLVKGAVESVLSRSSHLLLADGSILSMDESSRQLILTRLHEMTSKGLRCLGFAFKDDLAELAEYTSRAHPSPKQLIDEDSYAVIESHLVFVGIVGLRDPPREEVCKALQDCREAGIRVIVITGDNKFTAEAVCREIELFPKHSNLKGISFTGKEFAALSKKEQIGVLSKLDGVVFSRAEPKHKLDIVRLLKEKGEIVAMTGDGVNDAPALKLADIGIAMGITGTEVAKETSDMILTDDNFNTIVCAIAEGRSIYSNMKAFIRYLISSNMGEVFAVFLCAVLGMPECLIPVHLLWVNLVTDGPPAAALGFNVQDPDIMQKPPRKRDDPIISSWVLFRYLVISAYVGFATVGVFILWYTHASFMGIDLISDGHTLVTLSQLRSWRQCQSWKDFRTTPFVAGYQNLTFSNHCDYFTAGRVKATTLSLSVLVALEMFNSLNALSEYNSLFIVPPWTNPWLLLAMTFSFGVHATILHIPLLARVFGIVPLSIKEWFLVVLVSIPVVLIDEVLKFMVRWQRARSLKTKTT